MTEALVFHVDEEEEGERLDRILAGRLPELSRSHVQKAFAGGEVLVDGRARPKSFRPALGAELRFLPPEAPSARLVPQDIPLRVVHEDEQLLVIDKPPDLVVHPGPGHPDGTLVNALLHHDPRLADAGDPARPGIVHRLDRETSGLLVVARTAAAHAALAAQLRDRSLGRIYLALSWGDWKEPEGLLEGKLGRHPRDRQRMAVVQRGGREAATRYEVIDELEFVQLCRVQLLTGRTHQIRVHFTHHGHPVVGDRLYGDDRRARNVRPVDRAAAAALVRAAPRQLLHASQLHLRHPATGEALSFVAPLAPDFAAALAQLRQHLGRPPTGRELEA
jgi:23S rRNA pseudouridine1911/1915/1917 synthase